VRGWKSRKKTSRYIQTFMHVCSDRQNEGGIVVYTLKGSLKEGMKARRGEGESENKWEKEEKTIKALE
jgi:hypothetical protein